MRRLLVVLALCGGLAAQSSTSASRLSINVAAAWGDSLTAGNEDTTGVTYPGVLQSSINHYVYNGGVGGQTSTQIAARMLAAVNSFSNWSSYCSIIWAGRNNYSSESTVLTDVASMVSATTAPCYLVMSVLNGEYVAEHSGGSSYTQVTTLNTALAAAYPSNYLDIRELLAGQYNSANPLDVFDHSNDVPPSSLRDTAAGTATAVTSATTCSFNFTLTSGDLAATGADVLLIDSEYIYVSTFTGTSPTYTVTGCTRGYVGTAATHSTGAAISDIHPLHLNATGYTFVSQQVAAVPLIAKWL